MGQRQHRCPFYLLKITPKDLERINSTKSEDIIQLSLYENQLNSLSLQFQELKGCFNKIIDILNPFINTKKNYSLQECVQNSLLNEKTKKSTLSLIRKYENYCSKELAKNIGKSKGELKPEEIQSVYNPQNAYNFICNKKMKYKRSSIKKNLNTLLRYLKLATKNPFLTYDLPIGLGEPPKLKHIISQEELNKFVKYLNSKKLYIMIVICMLMYKFGLRIGALAKLKTSDLLNDDIIIFKEKNSKIIKRQLLKETANILRTIIFEHELKDDDYFFYFYKFKDNENQRCQFFIAKMRKILHQSNCFSISTAESLSSHIFRTTYAVNSYKNIEIEKIKTELGHKFINTTINSYINPERRALNLLEEKHSKNKIGIESLKRRINDKESVENNNFNKITEEGDFYNSEEEGSDFIDDDFETKEPIFCFSGHFYEDRDFIEYKNKIKDYEKNSISQNGNEFSFENESNNEKREFCENKKSSKIEIFQLVFNSNKNKRSFNEDLKTLFNVLNIKNFEDSVKVYETENGIIKSNTIKNKNDLNILSENNLLILNKTIELIRKGIFYNIKAIRKNGIICIESTNKLEKLTLITIIGGTIFYNKNYNNIFLNDNSKTKKKLLLIYFKTAKASYDRIINVSKNSIINYFFPETNDEANLEIIKIVDKQNLIKLIVVTKRIINKGEILALDKNLLFFK
jgi:integrase